MKHLAIIADGNRRWSKKNKVPIQMGYIQGLVTIENCCDWSLENDIDYLSIFCFSTENWRRSKKEVDFLMELGLNYFQEQKNWYFNKGIRVIFKGNRNKLQKKIIESISNLENFTRNCTNLTLLVHLNYGGQQEIVEAIEHGAKTFSELDAFLTKDAPYPNLILRTGGQYRLSNFMLWQSAYSELFFIDVFFPDLTGKELNCIKEEFQLRIRNYGK